MKPSQFKYAAPESLEECLQLLAEHGDDASVLAGGQSLVPLMNLRIARPEVLVDVNRVPGLDAISVSPEKVSVGATVRASRLERDPEVAMALPLAGEALRFVGHPPIRNRTTVGGNIAHADSASELPSVLAALDGSVRLASRRGERTVRWDEFLLATFMTTREADELLVGVDFPVPPGMRFAFDEVARRHGDFALVGACVGLSAVDDRIDAARIALFGVGGTAVRAREAEQLLVGESIDGSWGDRLRAAVHDALEPSDDIHASAAYRRSAGATLVTRLAKTLAERRPR
jgi:carbon-monoxide dehydrogenase medium subunit